METSDVKSKCKFCNKEFNKAAYRNRHEKTVHLKNTSDKPKVKFACVLCDKQYNQICSLNRHITAVHVPESKEVFVCGKCSYTTNQKGNLKRHLLKVHPKGKSEIIKLLKPFKCSLCNAQYKHIRHLRYHQRKHHEIGGPPLIINRKTCPVCKFIATGKNAEVDIHKHFEVVHGVNMQKETLFFNSLDSFFAWKKETENKSLSVFVKKFTSPKAMLFRCHRCGVYRRTGSNKRHLKIMGSCKINAFCPAMIKVQIISDKCVKVIYLPKHIGHKTELKHIHLTKEERYKIAILLASKVPYDDILKGVRSSLSNNPLKRIHLMNKKDLRNIEKSFNLNNDSIKHPLSIEAWVQELKMSEDTTLLAYKRNDDMLTADSHNYTLVEEIVEDDKFEMEHNALKELSCKKETFISLQNEKKHLMEEFKDIVENSIETEEELKLVTSHIKQLIPTLKATKLASGRPLQVWLMILDRVDSTGWDLRRRVGV